MCEAVTLVTALHQTLKGLNFMKTIFTDITNVLETFFNFDTLNFALFGNFYGITNNAEIYNGVCDALKQYSTEIIQDRDITLFFIETECYGTFHIGIAIDRNLPAYLNGEYTTYD